MLDQEDEGTRIGVWVALGVVFFVLVGVIGGLVLRQGHAGKAGAAKPAAAAKVAAAPASESASAALPAPAASGAAAAEVLLDAPITGELVGKLFFDIGKADLPADAGAKLADVAKALAGAGTRSLVISGFHDASGDPAVNAELAKQRAIAVREALKAAGVDAARLKLRKPESTTAAGPAEEARRVELRLVD